MTAVRPAVLVLLAALLALAVAPYPEAPASASCVGPSVVGEPVLHRGEEQTVKGQYFIDGCADTQPPCDPGCSGCTTDESESPMEDVVLQIRQQGRSWILETADANGSGDITWTFTLPPDVRRGQARLVTNRNPVVVMVE